MTYDLLGSSPNPAQGLAPFASDALCKIVDVRTRLAENVRLFVASLRTRLSILPQQDPMLYLHRVMLCLNELRTLPLRGVFDSHVASINSIKAGIIRRFPSLPSLPDVSPVSFPGPSELDALEAMVRPVVQRAVDASISRELLSVLPFGLCRISFVTLSCARRL